MRVVRSQLNHSHDELVVLFALVEIITFSDSSIITNTDEHVKEAEAGKLVMEASIVGQNQIEASAGSV